MKKIFALVLTICLVLALFVGCSSSNSSDKTADSSNASSDSASDSSNDNNDNSSDEKWKIGFLPLGMSNEYFINMVDGAEVFAENNNIELVVQASADQGDAEAQLGYIENMIASGVDAICICPCSADGLVSAVKKCQDAGIVVINLDTKLNADLLSENGCEAVPFYGTDNYDVAVQAAEFLMGEYAQNTKVAILTGVEGQENALLRRQGFEDKSDGYFDIVASQAADWDVEQGYNAAQNILNANPDLEVFYCCNDNMAIGAMRACQEAGRTDIGIVGVDAISEAVGYVQSGDLLATIAQKPITMAELGLESCLKVLNGECAYSDIQLDNNTGSQVITQDSAAEYLEYLGSYSA